MELTEQQFERIARWLDGQELDLTAPERAAAEDLRRLEAQTGALLDVALPPEAMVRARRRMLQELAGRRRRTLRWAGVLGAAAAAAAAIIVVLSLRPGPPPGDVSQPPPLLLADVPEAPTQGEIDLLDKEVRDLEARLITSTLPGPEDAVLEPLWYDVLLPDELEVELEG
jgi:hypothetical protein